ncbi:hypothetical protein SFC65_24300 [Priestia filamentosa]|uniref:hypothetical protein n=1 Tax=Priestia filamentosa TaxID=1402861 RepID=UPI0039828BCB
MDIEQLREHLEDIFKEDPLRKHIKDSEELEKYLFPGEFLKKLNIHITYSVKQAADILSEKDHTLRNYMQRNNLDEYIKPERVGDIGSRYRLDFKAVVRFHMIFLLANIGERTPSDIAIYVGSQIQRGEATRRSVNNTAAVNDPQTLYQNNAGLNDRFERIEKQLLALTFDKKVTDLRIEYKEAVDRVAEWEIKISYLQLEIENLELHKKVNRQENHFENVIKESHKKIGSQHQGTGGFIKNLFSRPKIDDKDYEHSVDSAIAESRAKDYPSKREIDDKIHSLRKELGDLKVKKEELLNDRDEKKEKYLNSKNQYDDFLQAGSDIKEYLPQ